MFLIFFEFFCYCLFLSPHRLFYCFYYLPSPLSATSDKLVQGWPARHSQVTLQSFPLAGDGWARKYCLSLLRSESYEGLAPISSIQGLQLAAGPPRSSVFRPLPSSLSV